jgi:hypothetical protein
MEKHNMDSTSARKIMPDGRLVAEKYSKVYLDDVSRMYRQIRREFVKANPGDNTVPVLRDAEGVMAWPRARNTKKLSKWRPTPLSWIVPWGRWPANTTTMTRRCLGAQLLPSPPGSAPARAPSRRRLTGYGKLLKKLGHATTTFGAWGVFRVSLATIVLHTYCEGFGEGEVGLREAIHADRKVQGNKDKSDLHAFPRYEVIVRYPPPPR